MKTNLPKNFYMVRFTQNGGFFAVNAGSPRDIERQKEFLTTLPGAIYVDTIIYTPSYYEVIDGEFTVTPELAPENP